MGRVGERYALMVRVHNGEPVRWTHVHERNVLHIEYLLGSGWRLVAMDSDVLSTLPPIDPAQSGPRRTDDEGED